MERSADDFALHAPSTSGHGSGRAGSLVIGNPLRDDPHAVTVVGVKRFGLIGLVVCAVGAACLRVVHSLTHHSS